MLKLSIQSIHFDKFHVLSPLQLEIDKGRWCILIAPSGSGKTTLLKVIAGGYPGVDYSRAVKISLLAQQPLIFPWLRVKSHVSLGDKLTGRAIDHSRVQECLLKVGLESWQDHYPQQLSIGMQQRLMLARTLYDQAELILCDEPLSGVDAIMRESLYPMLYQALSGRYVMWVTHDLVEANRLASQLCYFSGPPLKILQKIDIGALSSPRRLDVAAGMAQQSFQLLHRDSLCQSA